MKIFWSYARRDDRPPLQKVFNLQRTFETVLSQVLGKDCEIYFDTISLKWGVEWRKEIERLIKESDGFVAIVTPSYFNSRMCMFELQMACAATKKILPIYFRNCQGLKSTFKEDGIEAEINKKLNNASLKLNNIQMKDFRELRNEKLDSQKVENFLDEMAEEIA
jgi:TIR domain-containing protein